MSTNTTITTKPFCFTPKQYFILSLHKSLVRICLLLLLYLIIGIAFLFINDIIYAVIFFLAVPILFGAFLLRIKRLTYAKANKALFVERYFTINKDFLNARVKDGTESKIPLTNVVKVIATKHYFLLYLSKLTFVYLPYSAFSTQEDQQTVVVWFKQLKLVR